MVRKTTQEQPKQVSVETAADVERTAAPEATQPEATQPEATQPVRGRALIDLPAHGLKCGEFGNLPAIAAEALEQSGEFDTRATEAE